MVEMNDSPSIRGISESKDVHNPAPLLPLKSAILCYSINLIFRKK